MKQFFYLLAATLLVTSCSQPFKKTKDGSQFKIIKSSGKKIKTGEFMELYAIVKTKDSTLVSSYEDGMPQYANYDTAQFPPLYKEVFRDLNVGDSVVIKFSMDTIMSKGRPEPWMKKGEFIFQSFKVSNVFASKEQADSATKTHLPFAKAKAYKKTTDQISKEVATTLAPQLKADDQILVDFMAKKGIKATKTDWGTYVAITTPGTGDDLTEKNVALVNYTGRTLADSVFDSNVDPKFGHVGGYGVDLSIYNVVPGWIDALRKMKKGSKATVLIPSGLAYGKSGRQGIAPNENLIFEMEVTDIITPEQNEAMQMARQKEGMEMQQKMQQMQQKMQEEAMKKAPKGKPDGTK